MADIHSAEFHAQVLDFHPTWESYPITQQYAHIISLINHDDMSASKKKAILAGEPAALKAFLSILTLPDEKPIQWSLAIMYDMLREDSSCFNLFEDALKDNFAIFKTLMLVLRNAKKGFIADKAAWLLSAVMGNISKAFSDDEVKEFMSVVGEKCSGLGALDAVVNVVKAAPFRKLVMSSTEFVNLDFKVEASPPAILYKQVFILWMLSYEPEGSLSFQADAIVQKLKEILVHSRVEKVVRLSLTCVRNFLSHTAIAEEVVELGLLEVVQQLEYEKWRDAELYDDIRDMSAQISTRVQDMSNFDRYERELKEGRLKWGFIHSSKFWADNVLKFEQNDWRALKTLAALLHSDDVVTLAVSCHDLGEFVTAHPLGKKQIAGLGVKDRVMKLMSSISPTHKEVRREALLCCQKIMLNKWQDVEGTA